MKKYCIPIVIAMLVHSTAKTQSCPTVSTTTINTYSNINTYYPGTQASVGAGATSIVLGSASALGYGTIPINTYDIVLVIQMQGAQINSTNGATYGNGSGTGSGYLNNAQLMAGQMEYAVAGNAVSLTGGTLTLQSGLTHSYKNVNYSTDGQYRYQVIRVPVFYNAILGADIKAPEWNGYAGGVIDMYVSYILNMNGHTIDASSVGFRGGGGKAYSNVGSGASSDYVAPQSDKAGGSKGEGIAGTPIYLDSLNSTALIVGTVEGYPGGSYDRGAPGNAGGGATDGTPTSNSNNAGGGGGGNGGTGGIGGNSWKSNLTVGGKPGAVFAQQSPSRLVMGGGGGAGSSDGGTGTPSGGFASSGAPGGGIVIITAGSFTGTGTILANGAPPNTSLANDGSGGGGAGGSILIVTGATAPGLTVNANGSAGASNTGAGQQHGPGGGGGGGIVYSNQSLGSVTVTFGAAGTTAGGGTYGAAPGVTGISSQTIAISQTPAFPIICNGVLPVTFLSTSASSENGHITINWQVATEEDVQEYSVERSFNGSSFSAIATVTPKISGNYNNTNDYSYTDMTAGSEPQVIYYRIREMDISGSYWYSNLIPVRLSAQIAKLTVTPNPADGSATIGFMSYRESVISVRLTDITGNPVRNEQYRATVGMNTLPLDHLQRLPDGIYILQVYNGEMHEKVKMIIHH